MKKTAQYENENIISYAEYGDKNGYPIVINHGLIASIDDSYLFEQLIQRSAHLICIARPGYGESSPYVMKNIGEWAEIVSAVINELDISQFDVLGMSSGAPYSYALGYKFPERVQNIYIFSGVPALFDEEVLSHWQYEVKRNATIVEMQKLAYELFFSNLSEADLERNDVKDSMKNNCFGIAQDLRLRCIDWGFRLQDISANVIMQHSKKDEAVPFITALLTSRLLPNCSLEVKEQGEHFSSEALDDFINAFIAGNHRLESIK